MIKLLTHIVDAVTLRTSYLAALKTLALHFALHLSLDLYLSFAPPIDYLALSELPHLLLPTQSNLHIIRLACLSIMLDKTSRLIEHLY